jgi:vanadium nitrogenase delta subunit
MSSEKHDAIFNYIQERSLWQFFSRSWDRQENIDGILNYCGKLLSGEKTVPTSPLEKFFYAEAIILVRDFRERFPWIEELSKNQISDLISNLKERLIDIAITSSRNRELANSIY